MDALLALIQALLTAASWGLLVPAEALHALGRAFHALGRGVLALEWQILTQKLRVKVIRQARQWRRVHRRSFLVLDRFEPLPEKECKLLRRRIDLEETLKEVWR